MCWLKFISFARHYPDEFAQGQVENQGACAGASGSDGGIIIHGGIFIQQRYAGTDQEKARTRVHD